MSSAPRIVCKAGSSLSDLHPVDVNERSLYIDSPEGFEGNLFVRLQNFKGPVGKDGQPQPGEDAPFSGEKDTWSIAFEGKFRGNIEVDDILFGNTWEKPIKQFLPYGTSAALRFVKYVDPTLSCDLYSDKPWALSPLFSTLQFLSVKESSDVPKSFVPSPMPEDTTLLVDDPSLVDTPAKRRSHFAQETVRKSTKLSPLHLVRGDFSHGFLDFSTLSLSLPGGLSFSLAKYWNGEPVVFNAQNRKTGKSFFVVTFELQAEDGSSLRPAKGGEPAEKEHEEVAQSDDVD
ncbi:DUF1769 domain-containing protein [Sporobolomyces salmoneus]|uniref:DUF1769 domain-containing protein n=1 Tax=Sporobolomyces salmoneus TaxID=183962 RepID=UPI00317D5529